NGGVLFIDCYTSMDRADVVLSHQIWADEASLIRWREHPRHRVIQRAGREQHFRDYRIRVGRALDSSQAAGAARSLWVSYHDGEPAGQVGGELFKSVYRDGKFLALSNSAPAATDAASEIRTFDIFRDYTMYDRVAAPQDYPPVARR